MLKYPLSLFLTIVTCVVLVNGSYERTELFDVSKSMKVQVKFDETQNTDLTCDTQLNLFDVALSERELWALKCKKNLKLFCELFFDKIYFQSVRLLG